jgi:hypothetical protein
MNTAKKYSPDTRILLTMLPFWDPVIPPNGVAHLKHFLRQHGYTNVTAADLITNEEFLVIYQDYFDVLKRNIPQHKRGNFYNIGHDVLQNHFMAHINHTSRDRYMDLLRVLIQKTYYVTVAAPALEELMRVADRFFEVLERQILDIADTLKPEIVGFTSYKCTLPATLFACRLLKRRLPSVVTLTGGGIFVDTHAVGSPNFDALCEYSRDFLDKMFVGQGELLLLEFLRGNLPASRRYYSKRDLDGKILEFSQMTQPDYSDFDMDRYLYLPATGSASCTNNCAFCSTASYYGTYRRKEPRQLAREMVALHERFGHRLFFMTDSMLNEIVTELARELVSMGQSLFYDAYFRVDDAAMDLDNAMLWRKGGLYRVRLGVESGSQRMLDQMGKGITVEQIRRVVSTLSQAGIKTTTYWINGYPGETEEDFQATLDLMEQLKDDIFQSESNSFGYLSTQGSGGAWEDLKISLFGEEWLDMLVFDSYLLSLPPSREEIQDRMFRFVEHCRNLGIPNPYSFNENVQADIRWQRLHSHAVPSIVDLMKSKGETGVNLNFSLAETRTQDDGVFDL